MVGPVGNLIPSSPSVPRAFSVSLTLPSCTATTGGSFPSTRSRFAPPPAELSLSAPSSPSTPRTFSVSTLELGKHEVDLTCLPSVSFDDLEDGGDFGFGKWSTSFRLSSPACGARLSVTFSCSLVGAGGGGGEQRKTGKVAGLRRGSMTRLVSVQAPTPVPARSRDMRVLHEVLVLSRNESVLFLRKYILAFCRN